MNHKQQCSSEVNLGCDPRGELPRLRL